MRWTGAAVSSAEAASRAALPETGVPHMSQKDASGARSRPQLEQTSLRGARQPAQNNASARFSREHVGQTNRDPSLAGEAECSSEGLGGQSKGLAVKLLRVLLRGLGGRLSGDVDGGFLVGFRLFDLWLRAGQPNDAV